MALIRPRLNDSYDLPFTQEQVSFSIPLLDSDVPLYVDPFLLWKSPSQQDHALHTALIAAINQIGRMYSRGEEVKAIELLVGLSEQFTIFDVDNLPTNSDVVMMLSQYSDACEAWRSGRVRTNGMYDWCWNTDDGTNIDASKPTRYTD